MVSTRTATIIAFIPAFIIYLRFQLKNDLRRKKMSSTTLIACISSVLHDSETFTDPFSTHSNLHLSLCLRLLKVFVLCGKKLHNDPSFKNFLMRIEESLHKNAVELHGISEVSDLSSVFVKLLEFAHSLLGELDIWFVTMLTCFRTPRSTSLMTNEILETISSVLETIVNFPIDPLKVQLRCLDSLIRFVTKRSVEAGKDLLSYAETVVIYIAHVLFRGLYKYSDENLEEMLLEVSKIVQKMKPIDPQVYDIYTQSLRDSKFSEQLLDDDALLALKNFLDSIMFTLADIIWINTGRMNLHAEFTLTNAQLQELYERLRSLRIIVKQHPIANFDVEIQNEIADVITDAGISICSIYQPQVDVIFGHQHLLDKFKIVLSKIADTYLHIPIFNSPRTSSYGFVGYILEKLMEVTSSEPESTAKRRFQIIQVELVSIRSYLGEVVELRDVHGELQTLWDRLLEVALKVDSAIDYQAINPILDTFSTSFESILEDIGNLKVDVLKIQAKEVKNETYIHSPPQTTPSTPNHDVIGFQDEEREVIDQLRGGSHHLRIVAIVGMPGLGKTTLAKKVYDHSSLSCHFSAKAWCTISQVLDKKNVLFHLLKQIGPSMPSERSEHDSADMPSEMGEHDFADKLRRSLKGRRYLIVLDDIWNSEAWKSLKDSFPNDTKGSRIIFTSRYLDVAPSDMLDQKPLILSPLCEKDSYNLMCSRLFPGKGNDLLPALHDVGMQIVARCGGLPLAIITVAGVLASTEATAWEGILGSFSFLSSEGNCRFTWEFSYMHLPDYLRPCFLYFGMFPEDREVPVRRLLRIWIAEGFVRKSETHILEDVAEDYLNKLICRSLIMVDKRRSDGGVKTCRIHDLLHDFCLEKAKDEHFFHSAKGYDELYALNEPRNLRRLYTDFESLRESNLYCPHARSLLLRSSRKVYPGVSPILHLFKLLKVLDLEEISTGSEFPSAIQQLVLLTFLAITGTQFTVPSWLPDLSHLETLIFHISAPNLLLPDNLWNLQKLKYLYIKKYCQYKENHVGGVLPIVNLDDSSVLYELERFRGAILDWCSIDKQLSKFPNIRKLKCIIKGIIEEENAFPAKEDMYAFPEFSSKLESLDMHEYTGSGVRFNFSALKNLHTLKLAEFWFYWDIFSVIGNQLPSLQVFKLELLGFLEEEEYTWEMKEGEFSKLRILHLTHLPLRRWIACDDHEFECFQKLVIIGCYELVELPSCLETIETLEAIELNHCSKTTKDLVTEIEEAQNSWGNSGLKITHEVPFRETSF